MTGRDPSLALRMTGSGKFGGRRPTEGIAAKAAEGDLSPSPPRGCRGVGICPTEAEKKEKRAVGTLPFFVAGVGHDPTTSGL